MTRSPDGFEVGGAIRAEIYVLLLKGDELELAGPNGPEAWLVELDATEHPVEVVNALVRDRFGPPRLVHSTSWRHDGEALILSFVVAIDAALVGDMVSRPVPRARLARSEATAAPATVADEQVIEHGLRHLAWLAADDPKVSEELTQAWRSALRAYLPEPFRNLG